MKLRNETSTVDGLIRKNCGLSVKRLCVNDRYQRPLSSVVVRGTQLWSKRQCLWLHSLTHFNVLSVKFLQKKMLNF